MHISRELAIKILKYLDEHKDFSFWFPFLVMCKEYTEEDDDFVEVEPQEWEIIAGDENYQTFELWENLQNLGEVTMKLMSKGFMEEITHQSLRTKISELAKDYRAQYVEDMWVTHKTVDYGDNEFIGGKAEAYEDCLKLMRDFRRSMR